MTHDAAHKVHRCAQALNEAVQGAVEAGYEVRVSAMEATSVGEPRWDIVSVTVLKQIRPGKEET